MDKQWVKSKNLKLIQEVALVFPKSLPGLGMWKGLQKMLNYTAGIKDDLGEKYTQHSSNVDQNLATKKIATSNDCAKNRFQFSVPSNLRI